MTHTFRRGLILAGVVLFAGPAIGEDLVQTVRCAHEAARAAVRGYRSVETVERTVSRTDAERSASFERARAHIVAQMDAALAGAAADGSSPETVEYLRDTFEQQLARLPVIAQAWSLNDALHVQRTEVVDLALGRLRTDDLDLRDLPAMMSNHGIPVEEKIHLDRSLITIRHGDREVVLLPDGSGIVKDGPVFRADVQWLRLGVLPESAFEDTEILAIEFLDGDQHRIELRFRDATSAADRLRVVVDPGYDYRIREYAELDGAGNPTHEMTMSSYQLSAGLPTPAHTTRTWHEGDRADRMVEQRTVTSLEWLTQPDPATFEVPPGHRVVDARRTTVP